jgi:hypothetical protein
MSADPSEVTCRSSAKKFEVPVAIYPSTHCDMRTMPTPGAAMTPLLLATGLKVLRPRRLLAIIAFIAGGFVTELVSPVQCSLVYASRVQVKRQKGG